jgi:hypothetical protein
MVSLPSKPFIGEKTRHTALTIHILAKLFQPFLLILSRKANLDD